MGHHRPTNRPLRIGELARLAEVSADSLRHYERCRLLPAAPRSEGGYRLFPPESLIRVRLIRRALAMGFSLRELAGIFDERDRGGAPCRKVRDLAAEKLAAVEAHLRHLQSLRRELRATLAEWDRLLSRTPQHRQARLLEKLPHPKSPARESRFGVLARGKF